MSQRNSLIDSRHVSRRSLTLEKKTTADFQTEQKIRIGQQFQVSISDLADSNNWTQPISEGNGKPYGDCVWNAELAAQSVHTDILEGIVPHDRKEVAFALFHNNDYKIDGILDQIMHTKPSHGLDWSPETKQIFQRSILKSRKDFAYVSNETKQSIGNCQNYYYGTFKKMSAYHALKKALQQDLEKDAHEHLSNVCAKCKGGGKMISCSICQKNYHVKCCEYPPKDAETNWYCNECDPQ